MRVEAPVLMAGVQERERVVGLRPSIRTELGAVGKVTGSGDLNKPFRGF